ncbi:transposase [Microbispora hainanensis]|uniref:transposase n=1 Tax=Microbispora hainanensis TaxID=568844 RepID=UPI00142ECF74|nr:transposase [Microbispora hainanensis]
MDSAIPTIQTLRLFAVAARLVRGGRRLRLRIAASWPWAGQLITGITRLQAFPAPI